MYLYKYGHARRAERESERERDGWDSGLNWRGESSPANANPPFYSF